jgi:tRNA threonylcarbamoyladenosine biosynthesis protein TsaE
MARGISEGARGTSRYVRSPTFTLINHYPGPFTIYHVDLYRIGSSEEIIEIGLEELLSPNLMSKTGAILIEWAERLGNLFPNERVDIHFQTETPKTRNIWLQAFGETHRSLIHAINCDSESTTPLPTTDTEFKKLASPSDRS